MITSHQNVTNFRNLVTLSDVKTMGKYWLNLVFLESRDKKIKSWCYLMLSIRLRPLPWLPSVVWWILSRKNTALLLYQFQNVSSGSSVFGNILCKWFALIIIVPLGYNQLHITLNFHCGLMTKIYNARDVCWNVTLMSTISCRLLIK